MRPETRADNHRKNKEMKLDLSCSIVLELEEDEVEFRDVFVI